MWNRAGAGCRYQALQSQAQGTVFIANFDGLLEEIKKVLLMKSYYHEAYSEASDNFFG